MPLRPLSADDIFISYARRDSSTYATGLADELTKRGFSCFIDRLGTEANKELPGSLRRKIRSCAMLVIVGTEWSGTRTSIEDEIREFKMTGRTVVPVDIDGKIGEAVWYPLIEGIAPEPEKNPAALDDGNPSPSVVSRVEKVFKYARRNERLRRMTLATALLLLLLVGASVYAGNIALRKGKEAAVELERARLAREEADSARAEATQASWEATTAKDEAVQAKKDADTARVEAQQAQRDAGEQRRLADIATKEAREQTHLADAATQRAEAAGREADLQQKIAVARQAATRADAQLAQSMRRNEGWDEMLQQGVLLSVESARRLSALGLSSVDSTQSLRESLTLLPRSVHELAHTSEVKTALLTPDGKYLVTIDEQKELRFWNTATHAEDGKNKLASEPLLIEFSPDGSLMFTVDGDGKMAAFSVPQAEEQKRWSKEGIIKIHVPNSEYVAFDLRPDGKYIMAAVERPDPAGGDRTVKSVVVWDASDGRDFTEINYDGDLKGIALSPVGDLLAICLKKSVIGDDGSYKTDYVMQVWMVKNPSRMVASAKLKEGEAILAPAFSPDGKLLAVSNGYGATVLDVSALVDAPPPEGFLDALALGKVAGIEGFPKGEDSEYIIYIKFSSDSRSLGVIGDGNSVQTWDAYTGRKLWEAYHTVGPQLRNRRERYVALAGQGPGLRFVDATTGREVTRILHDGDVGGYDADLESERLVVFRKNQVLLYDTGSAQEDTRLVHHGEASITTFSANRKYAAIVEGKSIYASVVEGKIIVVWDVTAAREVARLTTCVNPYELVFSPEGSRLAASCKDNAIHVWKVGGEPESWRIPDISYTNGDSYNIQRLTFSPSGQFLVVHALKGNKVFDLVARHEVAALPWGKYSLVVSRDGISDARKESTLNLSGGLKYTFSPGEQYLAEGGYFSSVVQLWEATTGKVVEPPKIEEDIDEFHFSPDEKYLAVFARFRNSPNRRYVLVWNIAGGREVVRAPYDGQMSRVAFSSDGKYAVTSGPGESAQVLDLVEGCVIAKLAHDGPVNDASFSPDGRHIATASADRTARIWKVGNWREVTRVSHGGGVRAATINIDGRLATVSDDLTARLWLVSDEEMIKRACSSMTRNLSPKEWRHNFGGEKRDKLTCRGKPVGKDESEEASNVEETKPATQP